MHFRGFFFLSKNLKECEGYSLYKTRIVKAKFCRDVCHCATQFFAQTHCGTIVTLVQKIKSSESTQKSLDGSKLNFIIKNLSKIILELKIWFWRSVTEKSRVLISSKSLEMWEVPLTYFVNGEGEKNQLIWWTNHDSQNPGNFTQNLWHWNYWFTF